MLDIVLIGAVIMLDLYVIATLINARNKMRVEHQANVAESELPTVSICISARNEMRVLAQCLESVVASEYPKLEIIVLDDASQDSTSIIIKSFAHAGVRFIGNKPLPRGWIGKNYAVSVLAKEASGKYIVFLDVDTKIQRKTIYNLVAYAKSMNLAMASIVPQRAGLLTFGTMLSPLRHFWNIVRLSSDRKQASSNAWLVERKLLLNSFSSNEFLTSSLLLEESLANVLSHSRSYRLLMSDSFYGLTYEKEWRSHAETSVRLLYPEFRQSVVRTVGLVLILMLFLAPYIIVWWQPIALLAIIFNFMAAWIYMAAVWPRYKIIGSLVIPLTIFQEICLVFVSLYKYQRGTVQWKGRPIKVGR